MFVAIALGVALAACKKATKAPDEDVGRRPVSPAARGLLAGAGAPKKLYALRSAEIRAESPRGPVIGRILPGTLVTVVEGDPKTADGWVRVGELAPNADKKPLVAFVDRNALDVFRAPASKVRESRKAVRATFGYLSMAWYERGKGGSLRFRRCHEVWLRDQGDIAFQVLEGVELSGYNESAFAWSASPIIHHSLVCPAHAVTERDGKLSLVEPNPRWEPGDAPGTDVHTHAVGAISSQFTRVERLDPDELSLAIERGKNLFWMIATEKGPRCDGWRFERVRKKNQAGRTTYEARLVHPGPLERFEESGMWYPAEYRTAKSGDPAELRLETLRTAGPTPEGHMAMKCDCDYRYRVLARDGDAILALARPIPDDAIAFDAAEAERWFLDQKACEAHREHAIRAIEEDGGMTTRVGFHATELL